MTLFKRILCFVIMLVIAATAVGGGIYASKGSSSELKELEDMLAAATSSREKAESALSKAESSLADAIAKKQAIDSKIYALDVEIEATLALIDAYNAKIEEKNVEITDMNAHLDAAYQVVRERLRAKHEDGSVDFLSILFSAEGLTEFFTEVDRFVCMLEYDKMLLNSYSQSITELEGLRAELTATKADLDEQNKSLERLRLDLEADLNAAKKLVASNENKLSSAEADLERIEAIELEYAKKREELLEKLKNTTNQSYVGGEFLWPLPQSYTKVSSGFGWRIHPVTKKQQFHNGIDIPAPYGTEIYAVNDGTVVECSQNYADGYYITIDHGGGIASFYSHLSRYRVSVGDKVVRGQVIANVGTSGYTTGAHLNLNVYVDGQAVNPLDYYK